MKLELLEKVLIWIGLVIIAVFIAKGIDWVLKISFKKYKLWRDKIEEKSTEQINNIEENSEVFSSGIGIIALYGIYGNKNFLISILYIGFATIGKIFSISYVYDFIFLIGIIHIIRAGYFHNKSTRLYNSIKHGLDSLL